MEVGLRPGHIVLDKEPAPLPQKAGRAPQFSAHFYCRQTAGCINMAFDMEVALRPSHIVLDGDPSPLPQKGTEPPIFGTLLSPDSWMDQDGTWYGGRPRPRRLCVRWGPSCPQNRAHPLPPSFWPMFIVAKRLDG